MTKKKEGYKYFSIIDGNVDTFEHGDTLGASEAKPFALKVLKHHKKKAKA